MTMCSLYSNDLHSHQISINRAPLGCEYIYIFIFSVLILILILVILFCFCHLVFEIISLQSFFSFQFFIILVHQYKIKEN